MKGKSEKMILSKQREIEGLLKWTLMAISVIATALIINHVFHLNMIIEQLGMRSSYLYLLLALYVSAVFLIYPTGRSRIFQGKLFLFVDILAAILTFSVALLCAFKSLDIEIGGWMMVSPMPYPFVALFLILMVLEATRRSQGLLISMIILVFALLPFYADRLPGFLEGVSFDVFQTLNYHAFSLESLIGLPLIVTGDLVLGFFTFGVALVLTGGGKFFMDFALAVMGRSRGGAAKVAVMSSGMLGSISGSALSNIVTTGSLTIPAMVKAGFPRHLAAATEACASTGGVLMPPIMGATAFLMAEFLNIPYLTVALAALIPSLLYYLGLLVQVDAYAALNNMSGLSKEEIPSIKKTLKEGWFYIAALLFMILFLFLRLEAQAPFYATAILLICTNFRKETRLNGGKIVSFFVENVKTFAGLIALIAAIGMIIGSLSMTGVAHSLSREIVYFAGDNVILLVIFGAVASYILGMGVTITACYVLLSVTLAPSLIQAGLDPIAVNLFLLYCGMLAYLTLPVAASVYTAAGVAMCSPISTGLSAMRLGIATYIVPFFFVFNPALIFRGEPVDIFMSIVLAFIGIWTIASALSGYMLGLGALNIGTNKGIGTYLLRSLLFLSGILIGTPERITDMVGFVIALLTLLSFVKFRQTVKGKPELSIEKT